MSEISDIRSITGSRVRASILEALLREDGGRRSIAHLADAAGVDWTAAHREVRKLVASGVLRPDPTSDRRQGPLYEADPGWPGHQELRRLVLVRVGIAGEIRRAIAPLDPHQLAWIHGPYAEGRSFLLPIRVAAITREPRQVRDRLHAFARGRGKRLIVDALSLAEWTWRLGRREMRVVAIRRAQRLWLLGDGDVLRRRERDEVSARENWKEAIKNWRDEADWDEDWDPFAPVPGPG